MADPVNPKHIDKRTTERYQRSGQLSEEAYKSHIENLPDVTEKSMPVATLMQDEDLEGDDDLENDDDLEGDEDEDEGDDEDEGEGDEDRGSAG